MDYKDTLLMNKTNFEMRGNLNQKEPVLVEKWKEEKLYEEMKKNSFFMMVHHMRMVTCTVDICSTES